MGAASSKIKGFLSAKNAVIKQAFQRILQVNLGYTIRCDFKANFPSLRRFFIHK